MKLSNGKYRLLLLAILFFVLMCNTRIGEKKEVKATVPETIQKPGSSFNDTVLVQPFSAVFFEPDPLQLEKLKAISDSGIFGATMHDYFFQTRNAKNFLQQFKPMLKVVPVKEARFLLFCKTNNAASVVDLDKYEAKGMFVFNGIKDPVLIDMTNVETQVSDYFK
jgi:hypothetical protein